MIPYAFIMTWLVGFIMGIITLGGVFVYLVLRKEKKADARTVKQIDADEEAAVELVKEELGGTILAYER